MLDATRSKVSKPQSAKSQKSKPSISKTSAAKPASALPDRPNQAPKPKPTPKRTRTTEPTTSSPSPPPPPQPTTNNATMPSPTQSTGPIPLPPLRDLASSTHSLRRAALTTVLAHLDARPPTCPPTPTQAQQLWRALYVSLYMHDSKSAISVQNLARSLAGTVRGGWGKDREGAAKAGREDADAERWTWSRTWAEAFWGEMAREWIGVDQWRMNKVLMLVRMLVAEGVACAVEAALTTATDAGEDEGEGAGPDGGGAHDSDSWRDYVAEVVALPLEVQRTLPDGLRMHVLDVWGDELEKLVEGGDAEGEGSDNAEAGRKREVVTMLVQAAKELSVFRQGEVNVPKNLRAKAKEIVQTYLAQ